MPHFRYIYTHKHTHTTFLFSVLLSIYNYKPSKQSAYTSMTMNTKNKSLLSRLRMVVNKVRLLLSSAVLSRTWQIASVIRRASSLPHKRHLSFSDRSPSGLVICNSVIDEVNTSPDQGSASSNRLIRTASCSSDDDIDKRAEIFINNFRRQLQMERQISLQLRYCRTNSFEPSP
ncbi:uncharacterized protein LOC129309948 [Prosopis cineraria]|uniref:uncharacterized protein LOC129309948 n=1 Tax=Prosopis cineraria TaxID=364024 RepID=UPI00240EEE36|nr:uncharacterized protein LOC129309948 [Prosopis cineraria]